MWDFMRALGPVKAKRDLLNPTGSIYFHCDPNASHYVKVIMDGVFGRDNFSNEIIWKRTHVHGGATRWGNVHEFYARDAARCDAGQQENSATDDGAHAQPGAERSPRVLRMGWVSDSEGSGVRPSYWDNQYVNLIDSERLRTRGPSGPGRPVSHPWL